MAKRAGKVAKRIHFFNADGAVDLVAARNGYTDYEIVQHATSGDRHHGCVNGLKAAEDYARQLFERGCFS